MTPLERRVTELLSKLSQSSDDAVLSETLDICRVDGASCRTEELLGELRSVAQDIANENLGMLRVYGDVEGELDTAVVTLAEMENEHLSIVITKQSSSAWGLFYTEWGFINSLDDDLLSRRVIWVCALPEPFATFSTFVCGWDGPRAFDPPAEEFESPRKLVRDRTHRNTPANIAAWLLHQRPARQSAAFDGWRRKALQQLAFSVPFEVENSDADTLVTLKGSRTVSVPVSLNLSTQEDIVFERLSEAILWTYRGQRDAETKFLFLNNHLSLDWKDGDTWPMGTVTAMPSALSSARDAFAFYLQDQSRDALRSLADLRRGLQEEVTKVQQASRDLVNALWRDFAIAAAVLAVRYVPGMSSVPPEWLRVITLAAAVLLTISLLVSIISNARYHHIMKKNREQWRLRLYAFVDQSEWEQLVLRPIRSSLQTYRMVGSVTAICYAVIIAYLFYLGQGAELAGHVLP